MKRALWSLCFAVAPAFAAADAHVGSQFPPLPGDCAEASFEDSYFHGSSWWSDADERWQVYANEYTCSGTHFMWLLLPVDGDGQPLDRQHLRAAVRDGRFLVLDAVALARPRKGQSYGEAGCMLNRGRATDVGSIFVLGERRILPRSKRYPDGGEEIVRIEKAWAFSAKGRRIATLSPRDVKCLWSD